MPGSSSFKIEKGLFKRAAEFFLSWFCDLLDTFCFGCCLFLCYVDDVVSHTLAFADAAPVYSNVVVSGPQFLRLVVASCS